MKRHWTSIIIFLLIGGSSACLADETTLVVGVEEIDYLPYYSGVNKNFTGFSRELLDLFAKKSHIKFIYEPLPVKRLFKEFLEAQTVDFKYPDNPAWSTDWSSMKSGKTVNYSVPDVISVTGVMTSPVNQRLRSDELRTLGVPLGFTPQSLQEIIHAGKVKISSLITFESLINMALADRVQGVYLSVDVCNYLLREKLKQPGALVLDDNLPLDAQEFSLASIKYPDIIKKYNTFLKEEAVTIRELKKKHGIEIKSP